jgi:hypothetical protein
MPSLFPGTRPAVVHRSTWPDEKAYRRAIAAFRVAHGREPRVDSRFPSERRLAAWLGASGPERPRVMPRFLNWYL